MRPLAAWLVVVALCAASIASFVLPLPGVAVVTTAAFVVVRRGRLGLLGVALTTLAFHAAVFGFSAGAPTWQWSFITWSSEGALLGLQGGLRLVAVLALNLTILSRLTVQRLLDGLALPAAASAFLGAVALSAQDLGRDAQQLVHAARLDGAWPPRMAARIVAAARLLPALLVLSIRRATIRAEALRLAGHPTSPQFAALVAVTALAAAGRMALVAVPNVSLTYVIVFAGGFLFGPRLGAAAGALAMTFTNLLLTGAYIVPFANVPAMACIGLLGGWLRPVQLGDDRWGARLSAGAIGFVMTLVFSVLADLATWMLVPEFRGETAALRLLLTAGIAFNAIPATINAVLFAAALAPLSRATAASGLVPATPRPARARIANT